MNIEKGRQVAKVVESSKQENKLGDLTEKLCDFNSKQTKLKLVQPAKANIVYITSAPGIPGI
jgi:hypothetical protein